MLGIPWLPEHSCHLSGAEDHGQPNLLLGPGNPQGHPWLVQDRLAQEAEGAHHLVVVAAGDPSLLDELQDVGLRFTGRVIRKSPPILAAPGQKSA